jgi:ABC-2 type transport system permease protein
MTGWRTLLPNAWYIAIREYRSRVMTRTFAIGTIVLAILVFGGTQIPILVDYAGGNSQTRLEVLIRAGDMPADWRDTLDLVLNGTPNPGSNARAGWVITPVTGTADQAQQDLKEGKFGGLLIVDRDAGSGKLTFTLRADWPSDGRDATIIRNAARLLAIQDQGHLTLSDVTAPVVVNVVRVSEGDGFGSTSKNLSQEISTVLVSTVLVVMIFMAIISYGMWVAMSVAEEKGSRVMELMLNATTPLQMLTGKVIGNGAAGLTQYGAVLLAGVGGTIAQGPIRSALLGSSGEGSTFSGLTPTILAAFLVLFLLGFLLYSLLYAALGSLVSRQEDVQSATSPLMMIVLVGYFAATLGTEVLGQMGMAIMSQIPFFSPYVMLRRVAEGTVAPWEFGLCVVLLLAACGAALFFAARIYSAGVLLYGQRVGLREVMKAARVSR